MDLEAIQVRRADEQMAMFGAVAKRVYCECGCGVWWYQEHTERGRPREYMHPLHRMFARNRRRRRAYSL
jgi:hypothetical protein